jgi:short-subunit dehydrogenase
MRTPHHTWSYTGITALITGASSGIGLVFARELAARGAHLVLVARSEDRLRTLAADLIARHGVRVEVIAADLSVPDAVAGIGEALRARQIAVDLLVNNAGFGYHGSFSAQDPDNVRRQVRVNVNALVELTHLLLPGMLGRGSGGVINVASTAAFQPVPHMAVYGATKAFVLSFSEALWAECRGQGVRVLALCPGATATAFFDVAQGGAMGAVRAPEQVVATGLRALEHGRSYVVDGWQNRLLAQGPRLFPRALVTRITERVMRAAGAPERQATRSPKAS